ncbi:alpha/beta-hydrolase [Russula earlei]|uniref:Alpha/beta-hydrolase n=1 Tax=Russula earlei TaxID=71964 RepID=A0ACC0UNW7_9AGAM|nr:alpha/beta-hydrolase [Russula earlei]
MPYVDIAQGSDFASLWYITNSPTGHVSSFDPDKPTVILLHPFFLDSTWLDTQFGDPRLNGDYNLIAFDQRAAGRTLSRPNGRQDAWTDAADLAFACHALWLPPAHVWASETTAANLGIRFAALFPHMVLSLTMLSVPSPTELEAYFHTCDELLHMWAHAEDLDTLEFALMQVIAYIAGPDVCTNLADEVIAHYETAYPPYKRHRLAQIGNVLMNREALTKRELAAIRQPCLLIHGDKNQIHPIQHAYNMVADLVNAKGGAKLYTIKGGQGYISVVPTTASVCNRVFLQFLSRLPDARSELRPPRDPLEVYISHGLEILAELAGDPTIAERDPLSPMSFSRISVAVQRLQVENYMAAAKEARRAFSPLGSDGRPMRMYSERKHDHWFQGDRCWMSYVENIPDAEEVPEHLPEQHVGGPTEGQIQPASEEVMRVSAQHRMAFNPGKVERMERIVGKSGIQKMTGAIPLVKLGPR